MPWYPKQSIWQGDLPRRRRLPVLGRDRWTWIPRCENRMLPRRSAPDWAQRHRNKFRPPWVWRRWWRR